jgi:hypothetical protein
MREHRLGMAVVCLHISAVLYFAIGILMFPLMRSFGREERDAMLIAGVMFAFCLAMVVGIEFVAAGLNRRRYWAWIAALCIFAVYATSAFLPIAAFGLWGLLDSGSREEIERARDR